MATIGSGFEYIVNIFMFSSLLGPWGNEPNCLAGFARRSPVRNTGSGTVAWHRIVELEGLTMFGI